MPHSHESRVASKVESSRAEASRADPCRAEPSWAESFVAAGRLVQPSFLVIWIAVERSRRRRRRHAPLRFNGPSATFAFIARTNNNNNSRKLNLKFLFCGNFGTLAKVASHASHANSVKPKLKFDNPKSRKPERQTWLIKSLGGGYCNVRAWAWQRLTNKQKKKKKCARAKHIEFSSKIRSWNSSAADIKEKIW